MIELVCVGCGEFLGYMVDCGPTGMAYCEGCAEAEMQEDE